MTVSAVTAAASTTSVKSSSQSLAANFDNFLKLLTTQLQNQDPLAPMDANAFTSQLVQFASVEQAIATNTKLGELGKLIKNSGTASAMGMLGQQVAAGTDKIGLAASGGAEHPLPTAGSRRQGAGHGARRPRPSRAQLPRRQRRGREPGPLGRYRQQRGARARRAPTPVRVEATRADGTKVDVSQFVSGTVQGIEPNGSELQLVVDGTSVPMSAVRNVDRPQSDADRADHHPHASGVDCMSLFGSLFSGVSGLNAQSRAMGMISDNIANVNTTAYKGAQAQFENLVTRSRGSNNYSPGGVRAQSFYTVANQGLIQSSSSPTDAAISGAGFFVVRLLRTVRASSSTRAPDLSIPTSRATCARPPATTCRAGRWTPTKPIVDVNQLQTVNVRSINGLAAATTTVAVGANLDADAARLCRRLRRRRPRRLHRLGRGQRRAADVQPCSAGLRQPRSIARPDPGLPAQRGRQQLVGRGLRRHGRRRYRDTSERPACHAAP